MNINTTNTVTTLNASAQKTAEQKDRELKETCAAFEGMFLQMMMKTMRSASIESTLVKKSNGEKIFTEMLDQEYVNLAAKSDASGLGGTLYNHLKNTLPEYRNAGNYFHAQSGVSAYELNRITESSKDMSHRAVDFIK